MASHAQLNAREFDNAIRWLTIGVGSAAIAYGVATRSRKGALLALASVPLFYRGATGRWPSVLSDDTRSALGGDRGIRVRESIRLELPVQSVYAYWRQLENLPRFMAHLERVEDSGDGRSHWVATGPGATRFEWDAEIINDEPERVIAWRSLPGSEVVTAGSVNFAAVRDGRGTQLTVRLQFSPPAGKVGALVARLLGHSPSSTIREDLRHLKQVLEAGEIARVEAS